MKPRQDVIPKICQFFFIEFHSLKFLLVDLFERNRLTLLPFFRLRVQFLKIVQIDEHPLFLKS